MIPQQPKKLSSKYLINFFFADQLNPPKNIHSSPYNSQHLLIIRIICFIYLTIIYIWSLDFVPSFLENIIYMTMQGYFLTWLYFGLTLQDYLLNHVLKQRFVFPISSELKYYVQIANELALCSELPITIVFWAFLFKILLNMDDITAQTIAINANLHSGPLLCLLVELIYTPYTYKLKRYIIVAVFGAIYMIINLIYSLSYKPIYQPIDWVSILSYLLVIGSFVLSFASHLIGRLIFNYIKKPKLAGIDTQIRQGLLVEGNNIQDQKEEKIQDKLLQNLNKKEQMNQKDYSQQIMQNQQKNNDVSDDGL